MLGGFFAAIFSGMNEHPSIVALMKESQQGEDAEAVVRRKCRAMVVRAKGYGWSGPPFDPEILASLNGIKVEETLESFDGEGRIFPRREEVIIQVRPGRSTERRRFTICHELAHTVFPDVFKFIRSHGAHGITSTEVKRFEALCDIGAGELLMPFEEFSANLAVRKFCLSCVFQLKDRFHASVEATLRRCMDLTTATAAAVFLSAVVPPSDGSLKVRWIWKSKSFRVFVRPGTASPNTTCAHSATEQPSTVFPTQRETWRVDGQSYSWLAEAIKLPAIDGASDYPCAVVLLYP